jgi:hypothetical protein
MDDGIKWFVIAMVFVVGLPMAGLALTDYQKSQCKLAAIAAHMDTDEIAKVCK